MNKSFILNKQVLLVKNIIHSDCCDICKSKVNLMVIGGNLVPQELADDKDMTIEETEHSTDLVCVCYNCIKKQSKLGRIEDGLGSELLSDISELDDDFPEIKGIKAKRILEYNLIDDETGELNKHTIRAGKI